MKHISGRAHDVCVLARGRDGPDCWLRPPDPPPTPPQFLFLVFLGTMWHVKKGFGDGGGGGGARGGQTHLKRVGRPEFEGTETLQGGRGRREVVVVGGPQGWGEPGTFHVWMVNKTKKLVPENRALGCKTLRPKVPTSEASGE